jgi:hypothetical protein
MFNRALSQIAAAAVSIGVALGQDVDLPDMTNARVTIPYSELKELWKAAQQNNRPLPAKPPVAAELISARYEIEVRENRVVGFVDFDAQSFSDEWNALPLISADTHVHKVEPADATIILRNGNYALLTNRPSKQHIKMYFAAAFVQEGDGSRLQMANSPALVNVVTVKGVPAEKTLRVPRATEIANDKGVASFRIAPQEPIELRLLPAATTKPVPSQWETSAQCLARFEDDTLRYDGHVVAIATGGSALALNLKLPSAARVVSVSGEDLASWHSEDLANARVIALQWRTPGISSRKIDVVYELPQSLDSEWPLHAPENENGKTSPPIFAVTAGTEIELVTRGNETPASPPPQWLSERLTGIANVVITRSDKIAAKLLPVLNVAPAIVETAQFRTRIVADGSLINEQTYCIRTSSSVVWAVELPDQSELLSCMVGDHRISPVNRGHGALEIPIGPDPQGKGTRIALAYTARTSPFQPVSGRIKVELPKTPLLINSLTWELAIPGEYEVVALEGNLAPTTGAQSHEGSTVVQLKKELCRNERPSIELFYQKPEVKK